MLDTPPSTLVAVENDDEEVFVCVQCPQRPGIIRNRGKDMSQNSSLHLLFPLRIPTLIHAGFPCPIDCRSSDLVLKRKIQILAHLKGELYFNYLIGYDFLL